MLKIPVKKLSLPFSASCYLRLPNSFLRAFILFLFTLSLLGTVTNYVPVSALLCTSFFLIPLFFAFRESVSKFVLSTYILSFYFVITVLMYAPEQFFEYAFFRRDGNFFITFLPLLIFGIGKVRVDVEKVVRRFLHWETGVVLLCLLPLLLFRFKQLWVREKDFFLLFHAHNAAGGFLAVTSALTLGFALKSEDKERLKWKCFFAINAVACFFTHSRGSFLALLASIFMVVWLRPKMRKYFVFIVIVVIMMVTIYGYQIWSTLSPEEREASAKGAFSIQYVEVSRASNVFDRIIFLWPRAINLWMQSPILGIGFGAYNDVPNQLEGISGVFMLNNASNLAFSSGHAHHSFYHIMAETGIVGLLLTLLMLYRMNIYIRNIKIDALRLGMQLAFWVNFWASMTEHRLFTPSQMLPFIIILSLLITHSRYESFRQRTP